MLEASPREGSPTPDLESLRASLRAFARLRQNAESASAGSFDLWHSYPGLRGIIIKFGQDL